MDVKKQVNTRFQKIALQYLNEDFTLLDIGCSGGIDWIWKEVFGNKLQALGVDSNIKAINDLIKTNKNKKIKYINGLIVVPNEPGAEQNLWDRTSSAAAKKIASHKLETFSTQEIIHNNWYNYLETSNQQFSINELLESQNFNKVDFIKIDVDGLDFEILKTTKDYLNENLLGVVIEVGLFGYNNRFSRVDLFLNELGFELHELRPRKYDSEALPGRFEYIIAAQTLDGRIYQADALYLKDPCKEQSLGKTLYSSQQLLKLSLLMDMSSMSSWAAEILITFKETFSNQGINVDKLLDALAQDAYKKYEVTVDNDNKENNINKLTYKEYINIFNKDYKIFYPQSNNSNYGSTRSKTINRLVKKAYSLMQKMKGI